MILWNSQIITLRIIKCAFLIIQISDQTNNIYDLFKFDISLWCCNFGLNLKFIMKKIDKKYAEVMRQADNAVGRKEVVSLLKKAAVIMSKSEENIAA